MKRIRDHQLATSRALLVIVGLILLAGAVLGTLLATKTVDRVGDPLDAHTAVLNADGRRLFADHQLAFQLAALVAGLLLLAVGVLWLKMQIPPHRHQEDATFDNPDADVAGRNTIDGGALSHAFERDLERSSHIRRARAELRPDDGLIRLRLDIDEESSVDEIVTAAIDPAVARLVIVAEFEIRPRLETDLRPVAGGARRLA
jgi:hypothetical protein